MKTWSSLVFGGVLTVTLLMVAAGKAAAQDTTPGGLIPTNAAGNAIEWDKVNLEPVGEYHEWIVKPWKVPGTRIEVGGLGYQYSLQLEANTGNMWVVPTVETQILTALVGLPEGGPVTDWGQPADAFLPSGAALTFVEPAAGVVHPGVLVGAKEQRADYVTTHPFWETVLSAAQSAVSLVRLTALVNRSAKDHAFSTATSVYVYDAIAAFVPPVRGCADPACARRVIASCADPSCAGTSTTHRGHTASGVFEPPSVQSPGAPTPVVIAPTPWVVTYVPTDCSAPFVTQTPPQAWITREAPAYPLVVGQDPQGRGVDIALFARSFPVVYTWYEKVVHSEYAFNPATGRDEIIRQWEVCEARSQSYDDPIVSAGASAALDSLSQRWILGDLQPAYPGAYLRRPEFGLAPPGGWGAVGLGTMLVSARLLEVPFADPGRWDLVLSGTTAGTPVSPPAMFQATGAMDVWLLRVALTD